MFIRKKRIPSVGKTQSTSFAYQLVESIRTEQGPRQRMLLSLGSDIGVEDQDLKPLAERIEEIFTGQDSFFEYSEKIEILAKRYASQLINRLSKPKEEQQKTDNQPEYYRVDVNSVEQKEPRSVGAEHLLLHMSSQLDLQKFFTGLGLLRKEVFLALGTMIGRAVFPASERATYEWLTQRSGLGELLDFDFRKTTLDDLYRISDLLLENKSDIETYLSSKQRAIHGYQSIMVLYDMSNTYFHGQAMENPKAKRGRSKEKRSDAPLVTLGLVVNEHGFIDRSSFFSGNVSEPGTLQSAIESLGVGEELFKPVIVMDAGISTTENLDWLKKRGYPYIVSARQDAPGVEMAEMLTEIESSGKESIKVGLLQDDGSGERWLYCESSAKESVANQMKKAFCDRFEEELSRIQASLGKPRGRKQYDKIIERIGKAKEKHKRISGCYDTEVIASEDGKTATKIQWKKKEESIEKRLNGHYFLRTNLTEHTAEDLWNFYNSIRTVEEAFRFMKSSLGMRPVYHRKEARVDGHLWITVLAYHLIRSCLYQLQQQGVLYHWPTIRNRMSSRIRTTTMVKTDDDQVLHLRTTTQAEQGQKEIYHALNMSPQIMKTNKTVFKL